MVNGSEPHPSIMTNVAKIRTKSAISDAVVRTMKLTVSSQTNPDQSKQRIVAREMVLLRAVPNRYDAQSREELWSGPEHVSPTST